MRKSKFIEQAENFEAKHPEIRDALSQTVHDALDGLEPWQELTANDINGCRSSIHALFRNPEWTSTIENAEALLDSFEDEVLGGNL